MPPLRHRCGSRRQHKNAAVGVSSFLLRCGNVLRAQLVAKSDQRIVSTAPKIRASANDISAGEGVELTWNRLRQIAAIAIAFAVVVWSGAATAQGVLPL